MSVSLGMPSGEGRRLAGLAAVPMPSVALLAAGAPAWLCAPVIVISALGALRPIQFLVVRSLLKSTGASADDARKWAFRAAYYKDSPDPTLKPSERSDPAETSESPGQRTVLNSDGLQMERRAS